MRRALCCAFALLSCTSSALAYTEAPPKSYAKPTADGRFILVMLLPDQEDKYASDEEKALRKKYIRSGLYPKDDPTAPLWTANWYGRTVHASTDGVYAISINDVRGIWLGPGDRRQALARVAEMEALTVYEKGQPVRKFTVRELYDLDRFTDEQLNTWFGWYAAHDADDAAATIRIRARSGESVTINYRTGEVTRESRWRLDCGNNGPASGLNVLGVGAVVVATGGVIFFGVASLLVRRVPTSRRP
jgi:hypothetical protein